MLNRRATARVPLLVGVALLTVHCTDSAGPDRQLPRPLASHTIPGGGIQLDQWNAVMGDQTDPMMIVKGFNPTNPHNGDAIVATFFWFGTPGGVTGNIIDSVTDVLTTNPFTPIPGNPYELVEFVTHGSVSMATYVATNVQGFPDAGTDPSQILAIKADLSVPVVDGGVLLTAWVGVAEVLSQALGEHRSATGLGMPNPLTGGLTIADPGAISVNAGALAYGVSMSSPPAGLDPPAPPWTTIATPTDLFMKGDGRFNAQFTLSPTGGSVHPTWNWFFTTPGSWLATVLALNPAPPAPTTGNILVTTSTSPPENVPTSDYTVTVDGTVSQSIPPNGSVTFPDLQPGTHQVALSGLPANCQLTSPNPVTVTVVAGETATAAFSVTCSAAPPTTGNLVVTTSTSPPENVPASNYTVTLDGTISQPIPPNGSVTFPDLEPGTHQVALSGLPANCQLTSPNPVTVTVVAGATAQASFTVFCSGPQPPPAPNDKMTGGGKLRSGREFATFGFEASSRGGKFTWVQHCPDNEDDDDYEHNGPATPRCSQGKFSFHGSVTPGTYAQGPRGPNCRSWSGTGTSKQLGSATLTVQACDGGEKGRGVDYIEVTIGDYQNSGFLTGGNIQLGKRHERDDD
jgi:hypothetical protein